MSRKWQETAIMVETGYAKYCTEQQKIMDYLTVSIVYDIMCDCLYIRLSYCNFLYEQSL